MTTDTQDAREPGLLPDARLMARGLAALRIFFGVILFANGVAKLFEFRTIEIGPWKTFLINKEGARNVLEFEVNKRGGDGTDVPLLKSIVNDVMLPSWDVVQWLITAVELGAGLALILGLASRLAALVDLGQQLFLALVYLSSSRWMFEQPHEWVPLIILALVPSGRVWGLDGRLWLRTRRWPF